MDGDAPPGERRVLLVRHSYGNSGWMLPGGRPNRGEDPVAAGARELRGHDALQFLLAHEPESVLVHLAFGPGDRLLIAVGDAIAPAFTSGFTERAL